MTTTEPHIDEIHFRVNDRDYKIELEKPIMLHPYEEMQKSVKKEIERYTHRRCGGIYQVGEKR